MVRRKKPQTLKHGHSKRKRPFLPISKHTKATIKSKIKSATGPGTLFDDAFTDARGIIGAVSASSLPRGNDQIKNEHEKLRTEGDIAQFRKFLLKSCDCKEILTSKQHELHEH